MTRNLIIGDIHLNKKLITRSAALLDALLAVIEKYKPDRIIQLGDVFHNHSVVHVEFLRLYYEFLTSIEQPFIQLVGNHDMANSVTLFPENHALVPFKSIKNVIVVDKPVVLQSELFMPYVPNGRFLENIPGNIADYSRIYCHQEFKGAVMADVGDELPTIETISGHIHNACQLGKCWYVGTPIQHDFGDDENKAVYIVQQDGTRLLKNKIAISMPKYRTIPIDVGSQDIPAIETTDDFLRYEIKGTAEDLYAFKKTPSFKLLEANGKIKSVVVHIDKPQCTTLKTFEQILKNACEEEGVLSVYNQVIA
jgi:DNA repair exonuclease SbcCD nuclease subunit